MKLVHVAICTPGKCGLYETTRELVAAERALGYDARMYDPKPTPFYPDSEEDRGALLTKDKQWVLDADVVIDHSGCDGTTDDSKQPHILVCHGRPKHSFLGELHGRAPVYSYHYRINKDAKYQAVVTFWPEHIGHLQVMFRDTPVYCLPSTVDASKWTPEGAKHDFGGKSGLYNIVMSDAWRDDGDMFDAVCAVALTARQVPGLNLHIYGMQGEITKGWGAIFKTMSEDGTLGEIKGWVNNLGDIYRAADLLVTPHRIRTRAVREALACGLPSVVVDADLGESSRKIERALREPKTDLRGLALDSCSPMKAAEMMIGIAKEVCRG